MIMERYKEELNNLHAPEDLIMRTLMRVHEEEEKVKAENATNIDAVPTNAGPTNVVPTNVAPTNVGPTNAVPTNVGPTYVGQTNMSQNNQDDRSVVYRFEDYNGTKPKAEEYKYVHKKTFAEKYRVFIVAGSTVAAAALILFLAMGLRSNNSSTTMSDTAYETTQASADDSYKSESQADYAEEAAESDSYSETMEQEAEDSDSYSETMEQVAEETTESREYDSKKKASDNEHMYEEEAEEEAEETAESNDSSDSKKSELTYITLDYSPFVGSGSSSAAPDSTNEATIDEYSDYLDYDLKQYTSILPLKYAEYTIKCNDDGTPVYDNGTLRLESDNGSANIIISKMQQLVSDDFLGEEPSVINGTKVWIGEYPDQNALYAAYKIGDINFVVSTYDMSKEDFEALLDLLI